MADDEHAAAAPVYGIRPPQPLVVVVVVSRLLYS